jgi:hypothetical protein
MNFHFKKPIGSMYVLAGICLLFITIAQTGCSHTNPSWHNSVAIETPFLASQAHPDRQLIVFRGSANQDTAFDNWLANIKSKYGPVVIHYLCATCDSSLMLLDGKGVELYIQTGTAQGGSGSNNGAQLGGNDSGLYYCPNFDVRIPEHDTNQIAHLDPSPAPRSHTGSTLVAVFDTGLDTTLIGKYVVKSSGLPVTCLGPDAGGGWNFVKPSNNYSDDHPGRHGTAVTRFIINQVEKETEGSVAILPVKVFAENGTGDLFHVLCAFAYARQREAKIINASFGFYAKRDNNDPKKVDMAGLLFERYIYKYLTENNILLIAAAGNRDDAAESMAFVPNPKLDSVWRNLDSVSFYPASLSRSLPNVIPVTTLFPEKDHTGQVSPNQNYSPDVVYIGVHADRRGQPGSTGIPDPDAVFQNSVDGTKAADGSSFATPIATGKICTKYQDMTAKAAGTGVVFDRTFVLTQLENVGLLKTDAGSLAKGKVNQGASMLK